jgi:hypothetical protein
MLSVIRLSILAESKYPLFLFEIIICWDKKQKAAFQQSSLHLAQLLLIQVTTSTANHQAHDGIFSTLRSDARPL